MRKTELAANLIFLSPILVATTITCLLATPLNIVIALFFYSIGLCSLLQAKMSLFRQGMRVSFGPTQLDPEFRRSYWNDYSWIGVGVFINIVALLVIGRLGHGM